MKVAPIDCRSTHAASALRLSVLYRPISELKPDPRNPRQHSAKQVRQISASIQVFGFNVPILVDSEGRVIAGHGRLEAARELAMTEVPTISLEHLTPEQVKAFRIADNRLTDTSIWDERLLAEQLQELSTVDLNFDIEAIGFDLPEIDFRIQGLAEETEPEEVELPAADAVAVSQVGDLWQLGPHRVLCGDALVPENYQRLMADRRAHVVFTDPPYNVPIAGHVSGKGAIQHREFAMASGEMDQATFTQFLQQVFLLMAKYSASGSLLYVCMDWRHMDEVLAAGNEAFTELKNLCVWVKDNAGMGSHYRSRHELVFVFKSGTAPHVNNVQLGVYGRSRSNVWEYAGVNSFSRSTEEGNLLELHPTVKPVKLVADALMDASHRGQLVLDPFMGSGTTLIAAESTRRIAYGLEIDPLYVDVIVRRWQRKTGEQVIRMSDGRRFDDIEAESTFQNPTHP